MTKPILTIDFRNKRLIIEGSEKLDISLKDRPTTEQPDDLEAILAPNDLDKLARLKGSIDVRIFK